MQSAGLIVWLLVCFAEEHLIDTEIAVIGGGIIGLAIAHEVLNRQPGTSLVLLEKESHVALHQSGRNSGVIHSGIYYAPGSAKARLARNGCESIKQFCREYQIPYRTPGKLIVAVDESELSGLAALLERGRQNGIEVTELDAESARRIEPAVSCLRALHVPSAGVVNFRLVSERLRERIDRKGGRVLFGTRVTAIERAAGSIRIETSGATVRSKVLVNASGLFSDRVAALDGIEPSSMILPFRGEYYEVKGPSADLVKGLIYPVPDLRFPFLGIHLTRSVDDVVHAGPNAVLALAREGYRWSDISWTDTLDIMSFAGFWRFGARHARTAVRELHRSWSRRRFSSSARRLVPSIRSADLVRSPSGVRAQALGSSGELLDDFVIEQRDRALHLLNAPSPAATSSLEIAREVADRLGV